MASVQAIALICCFVVLFFSCEEGTKLSADKKIDQLVLTVGGADMPVTFGADYNAMLTVPLGTDLTTLTITVKTLMISAKAMASVAQGDVLTITGGSVVLTVTAENGSKQIYTILTTIAQPVVTTYTGTDTLGIAVRDVVTEMGRSLSFSATDAVVTVSGLVDASFDWALGTLTGTKTATAGTFILTQSDLAAFPATADATYAFTVSANGKTSEGKDLFYYPGQLRTWRDLQGVRVDLTGTYRMMRDIDFPDEDGDGVSAYNFEPLGRDNDASAEGFQGDAFSGTFDGGGHEIRNLYIDRSTESYVGLFGQVSGTVRNVGLAGGAVTGDAFVGGLLGSNNSGTIQGAYTTGAVTGSGFNVGSLVGFNNGMIQGVYATGAVTSDRDNVGGLLGANLGTIQDAYATGVVTGRSTVGGLVGINATGSIQGVYATGAVTGNDVVGGLVGNNNGTIEGAYAMGAVTGSEQVGGLVGINNSMIQGAYATGAVTGTRNSIGGLVGLNVAGTIQGVYATGAVTGNDAVGGLVGRNRGTVVGYARGNVTRVVGSTAMDFGRLVGFNEAGGTATGYYSSQTGESQLLSAAANGNPTALAGATGFDGTARTSASTQADFASTSFEFGEEIGQWIYTAGRWPALNLGDLQSAADQPTQQ